MQANYPIIHQNDGIAKNDVDVNEISSREQAIAAMKAVFREIPNGISHSLRVLDNAEAIMVDEKLEPSQRAAATLAAILHDIGAVEALRKHGSLEGRYQEMEGPQVAREILERMNLDPGLRDRVCFIVGNHHTKEKIDGIDFQVLWEADALDDLEFSKAARTTEDLRAAVAENFRTESGRRLAYARLAAKLG